MHGAVDAVVFIAGAFFGSGRVPAGLGEWDSLNDPLKAVKHDWAGEHTPEVHEIAVEIVHETELAWLVDDGRTKTWLPKSKVEVERESERPRFAMVTLPERLAIDKGLV